MLPLHERPEERKTLRFHLEQGRSIMQPGPRRVGKTWTVGKLAEDLRADGWFVVFADVQGMHQEEDFLRKLCEEIEAASKIRDLAVSWLRQIGENLKRNGHQSWKEALKLDPRAFASTLVETLAGQGRRTVLIIDEIALFVLNLQGRDPKAARDFLYHLRALQQAHPSVQWLFTGSVGLDIVAQRFDGGGALVDLKIIPLGPFDEVATESFLRDLCDKRSVRVPFSLDAAGFQHFVTELGWLSPYYIEHVAQEVRPSGGRSADHPHPLATIEDLNRAFDALLKPDVKTYFSTWPEHLRKNFPPDETAQLRLLLDACAQTAEGEIFDTLLARFEAPPHSINRAKLRAHLDALLLDAFLMETGPGERPRYRFRSGLLRRYWLRNEVA